jgi:hypothetical protein
MSDTAKKNSGVNGDANNESESGRCASVGEPVGQSRPASKTYHLLYGRARRPLATVVPDTRWPDMWRIAWPDGQLSDMVNLTRAKDAAVAIAERGPPGRLRKLLRWEIVCIEDGRAAPLVDLNAPPAPSIDPGQQIESCTPITPSDDVLVDCTSPDDGSL